MKPNASPNPFHLRLLRDADRTRAMELSEAADMGTFDLPDDTLIAADEQDAVIGFLRITRHGADSYVNPVVTDASWRGAGVGEALMREALKREGELLFVARGEAVDFYRRLGCDAVPWDRIAAVIAADCDGCDRAHFCHPQPMRMTTTPPNAEQ